MVGSGYAYFGPWLDRRTRQGDMANPLSISDTKGRTEGREQPLKSRGRSFKVRGHTYRRPADEWEALTYSVHSQGDRDELPNFRTHVLQTVRTLNADPLALDEG